MNSLFQDVRYALRSLIKSPTFTIVVVLALSLGIGATTAIFSVVNAVLLQPLPFKDSDQLMILWVDNVPQDIHEDVSSYPNFEDWRDGNTVFDSIVAYTTPSMTLTGDGEPEQIRTVMTSAGFFHMLGVKPVQGRALLPEENQPGREQVVVISDGLWKRRLGGVPNVIGRSLDVNGRPHTIVGIMPPGFRYPEEADLLLPLAPVGSYENLMQSRGSYWLSVVGRLKAGVTVQQAQAEMDILAAELEERYPNVNQDVGIYIEPMYDELVGNVRPAMIVLLGSVGFVLLIACANVANILLARAAGRQRELAVRVALGARRGRLIRQMLTESMLVAAVSGVAGIGLTFIAIRVLLALAPADIPRLSDVSVDGAVLAFSLLLSVGTGLIFGIAPALMSSNADPGNSMRAGGRCSTDGLNAIRFRGLLVVTEIAIAMLLLVGAGLLIRSFHMLQKVEAGFRSDGLLTSRIQLPPLKYAEGSQIGGFYDQLLERVRALPGVQSSDVASTVLLTRLPNSASVIVEDRVAEPVDPTPIPLDSISPGFFQTMGIPLVRGRAFTEQDRSESIPVVIVNEAFAQRYWPNGDALGERLTFGNPQNPNVVWSTIVGVVADVRRSGLDQEARPETYFPLKQRPTRSMQLLVRTAGDPAALSGPVKDALWSIDPNQPIASMRTMDALMGERIAQRRFNMLLLGIFAAVALALATVGIYGVISYSVTQRTQELGIRMALGARQNDVLRLVLAEGALLVAAGVGLGLAGAYALTNLLSSQLYGVASRDSVTFAAVAAALAAVALFASYIPARRASRVDPLRALRYE